MSFEMLDIVRTRLPPYPNWRWIAWHVMHGIRILDAGQDMLLFCQWAMDRWPDQDELYLELQLETLIAWATRGHTGVDAANAIYGDAAARSCIERSLLCGLTHDECASAVGRVTGIRPSADHVKIYEDTFFDRKNIGRTQMAGYYNTRGQGTLWESYQCPLPYTMQRSWALSQSGEIPEIDVGQAINVMVMRSLASSERLANADPENRYGREWAKIALRAMLAGKDLGIYKSGQGKLPDRLVAEVDDDYSDMDGAAPADGEVVFLKTREYNHYAKPSEEDT